MKHKNHGLRKVCGCRRRDWPKCPHSWHFSFKWGETHHRFSLDKHLGKHIDNKTDAETEAENIRTAIRAGRFGAPAPREEMTLRQLADVYLERYVQVERASTERAFIWALNTICRTGIPLPSGKDESAPLGSWRIADIVTDTIERFREVRRAQGTGAVGVNRNLESLRALYNWALKVGYTEQTPFRRHTVPIVKLSAEHGRARRLDPDTDEKGCLLNACGPHLRAVVECALETGMRRGEILSLQWSQIEGMQIDEKPGGKADPVFEITWAPRAEFVLPWAKTKTRRDRRIPISKRLKAVLEMRRFGPDGEPLSESAFVFGTEIGERVLDVKRAWMTAVLRAHGHKPTFTQTANLDAESRVALDAIDLHFHDLRREAGSRWLERGVDLHTVRDWLGHTSIEQTSTYLAGTTKTQHDAMRLVDEREAALQKLATRSKTGGRKRPRSAGVRERKPNETAIRREQAIM